MTDTTLMPEPIRPGARGGRDQFSWEQIKNDKDRYNYLGNSIKAAVKKPWDQGPEADWYVKDTAKPKPRQVDQSLQSEIEMIKAQEREYMNEVLRKGFGFEKRAAVPSQTIGSKAPIRSSARPAEVTEERRYRPSRERNTEQGHRTRSRSPDRRRY